MSTTVLSTIPSTPEAPAAPAGDAPAEPSEAIEQAKPEIPVEPEPPKEQGPDPDLEIARKLESVAKREARARKLEAQWQSKFAELDQMKADLARKLAEAEAALEDPIDWAMKKGRDPVELAKRVARPMTEEEKRIAKLEAEIAKDREERENARKEAEKAAEAREQARFWDQFISETRRDEFPYLTSMRSEHEIPTLVRGLLNRAADPTDPESPTVREHFRAVYGRDPTPNEIRQALEHEEEIRAMSVVERVRPKTAPSQATPKTPAATEESPSLSNQHAASSTSAKPGTKSREERMRELKAELEAEAASQS